MPRSFMPHAVTHGLALCPQLEGETMQAMYNLTDTVFAKAEVDCSGTVGLWLGVSCWGPVSRAHLIAALNLSNRNRGRRM